MKPLTVGEMRKAIEGYPDDTPIYLCDDQKYPKWTYPAYQVQAICFNDDSCEIYIEAITD